MRFIFLFICLVGLSACGEQNLRPVAAPAEKMIANQDWIGAVRYYQDALASDPDSAELRRGYYAVVERAVDHYATAAKRYTDLEDFNTAEVQLTQGLFIVPDSILLQDELARIQRKKQARAVYRDAAAAARLGRRSRAIARLERALSLDPDYAEALRLLGQLSAEAEQAQGIKPIRLKTGAAVSLNFRDASFKEAALALGQAYGVNMIFDADLDDKPVTLFAEDVQFAQAFNLLLKSNRAFYRRIGQNSVVIAPDTPESRAEYEDYIVRTFFLESAQAQQMADLMIRSLSLENVSANEAANSVTVRATREKIALADKLVVINDRAPAEVVMEVEILEINRTKSERLGLDFGSQISVTPPELEVREFNSLSDAEGALNVSALSLPAVTLRYFKQDVDANTLASPRIRTINKKEASILIGDRVPLRSSTIVDATGQTRTTFEYTDVGVKLIVTPEVQLNRSVLVNLELDVSSLGQNLGTADEPAFAIGTRTITTQMVLQDTETAVIGGLIRDEDRDTVQKVPGLGSIPAIGKLFRSRDGQGVRTDILLTLTPRVIRGRDVPASANAEFFSGTGSRITTQNTVDFLARATSGKLPTIRLDMSGDGQASPSAGVKLPQATLQQQRAAAASQASLSFNRSAYEVDSGDTIEAQISASGFPEGVAGATTIRFRPDLVQAEGVSSPASLPFEIDNEKGEIRLQLTSQISGRSPREIATISFRGVKAGLSYLVFSKPTGGNDNPLPNNLELRASRIIVR